MSTMTMTEILERAAVLVETRGKAIGFYEDLNGGLCAVGALRVALCGDAVDFFGVPGYAVYAAARAHLTEMVMQETGSSLLRWSDEHTAAEVAAGLRRAARSVVSS